MERIRQLYQTLVGKQPQRIESLSAAGSNRRYFRVHGESSTLIAVIGTSAEENKAFVAWSKFFKGGGLPVPEVFAVSDDQMVYLQEDLGSVSLYDYMAAGRAKGGEYSEEEVAAICKAIRLLPQFQFLPVQQQNEAVFDHCFPQREMDRTSVMFDLNYFKYCFLKLKGVEFNEYRLQQDFERLADDLLSDTGQTFLYRDFQSRNVMLKDGEPYFIDFQGGRRGPIYYDVASFLWQSSAKFSDALRERLIDEYLDALTSHLSTVNCQLSTVPCHLSPVPCQLFRQRLHLFVLFRILQVLGAYGYRGLWEKKEYFINSIPLAISNLQKELSVGTCDAYPYLKEVCLSLIAQNEQEGQGGTLGGGTLRVRVFSFSFKKGIPADESGNGGGYVFDCRGIHNPGRYDEYKPLTGLHQPVIDFLEADGEILTFLDSVYKLVDSHVARFLERGFTNLQISFGCTGGRHRSVYCAQHVAEHIHAKYGVEVHLCHREQNITQILK